MALGDLNVLIIILVAVLSVVISSLIIFFAMRNRRGTTEKAKKTETEPELKGLPFKLSKSVQSSDATSAKDELRILDLEREILGDAIRRLYEAHAEGKITEEEREKLAASYKNRMASVKESMAKDETIVALHELEGMQEDLMKLFSERFGELSSKVEELRSRIDVKTIKEVPVKMPTAQIPEEAETTEEEEEGEGAEGEEGEEGEAKAKKKKKPAAEKVSRKTEAEKRIDEIRSEVEKVLDKLGQMEIET
jgi:hypothetical protein